MPDFSGKKLISESILSDVANAIREKAGLDCAITPLEFADYILMIDGGKGFEYYDSWRGLISPMDGTFQQAYYNNGVAIGDKIYFVRNYSHSHYNGDGIYVGCWFCYDTTNNTLTRTELVYNGEPFGCSSLWCGDDGAIYGFGYPYRYKTTDYGVTWTRDEMTTPQYDPCPVYKLSNGRIIGTMLARTKMIMISDDEGLTWNTVTPFSDDDFAKAGISGYISMSHGTICELEDCLAFYFNSPMQDSSNLSKRYVSLSYDNGNTWTLPVACSGELGKAGYYICPGGMVYFGNKYHYFVSCRYSDLKYSEDENYYIIGDLKWFTGTATDVKNGTMTLKKVLSQTLCTTIGFDNTMASQDVGNSGVTLCNGALYVNHGNLVYNKDDDKRAYVSNSGIEIFRIGLEGEADAEPYWDANFKSKYQDILLAEDSNYNYYFYAPDKTNINSVDWWGYADKGYIPNEGHFKLPLGSGDFEINGIYNTGFLGLSGGYPRIWAGIEQADGTLHAIGAFGSSRYAIFDKANDSSVASGVLAGGSTTYFTFKRKDGVYTYTINGVTVTNPPFGWTYKADNIILGVSEPTYIYNVNASDETVQAWIDSIPQDFNMSGLLMLTISCDADYHGTNKDFSVTYNLIGCSSTNRKIGINAGHSYNTTISVNVGYELSGDITCTMGGVAQTVTDGVISIESVTGDIVITATAKETVNEPVLDGLCMCYSVDNYDANAGTISDECGVGATLTASFDSEHNMVSGSDMRPLTMKQFSELFSNGFSLSFAYYAGSVANNMFALNSTGASNGGPRAIPPYFYEPSNSVAIHHIVDRYTTHHYVFSYDAVEGKYFAYMDGELKGSAEKVTEWNADTSSYFTLGGWGGTFGAIRVYNRPLTADEVAQNYAYDSKTWTFDAS
ncbi:LamG-like jellyroll fold domain-containing protein [Agathobacter sp.]|uniref:LamG-like jellyroll fold domain-containing protein n=1 Tax=Agathobacter sp. TaxID=2021311 RepID=UPI002A909C1A|nr:LamG-like jellyroll fold domain-containing protein [Agathobacter sp.]MDY5862551.1 hypothetical protein [Agathobacter sp.]